MLKNYFKIAWRNLSKHKVYSIINVAGLATGIAASLLIFVVVAYELSYNKQEKNYARIYRIVTETRHSDGSVERNPGMPVPAAAAIKTDFPEFEKVVEVHSSDGSQVTVLGPDPNSDIATSKKIIEDRGVAFTDPAYFDMFNTRWLSGSAQTLATPGHVILNRSTAEKYFGDWKAAIGKFLKLDNTILLSVSGVVEDGPSNSDFPLKIYISKESLTRYADKYGYSNEWGSLGSNQQLYVLLPANANVQALQSQMAAFVKKHYRAASPGTIRSNILQPLRDMHFDYRWETLGDHSSSKTVLLTLSLIGMLIILMASINFINLSTAQAVGRSKEVGIRKVLGSNRKQLVAQVMGETFLIVLMGVLLALLIARVCLPFLSNVASVPKDIHLITANTLVFVVAVLFVVTLLSGIYPAMVLSGFTPALALKNKINASSIGGISLRRVLVVTQFSISQMLIIGTIVAVRQMNYVRDADLGFNKEAVMVMPAYPDSAYISRMYPLKQDLLTNPDVLSVSFANDEASSNNNWASNFGFDHRKDEDFPVFFKYADEDYLKTFGLQLTAGRWYTPSDTVREMVVNETLLKKLGVRDPQTAVGKTLRIGDRVWLPIVGVVKDFKTNSLREDIKPLVITTARSNYYTVSVKMKTAHLSQTAAAIKQRWEKLYPEFAFDSHFADETIEKFYRQDSQLSLLYKLFAGVAIFISCLGLYGLVSFMAVQKTKEVGIRKVLGASVSSIVVMFSKEFTFLIGLSFLIAVPVAWYFMNGWLENFVYRIHIGIGICVLAIVLSLLVAWITVGYRAVRAALANPVRSLRSD